jgi:hypothetical protein
LESVVEQLVPDLSQECEEILDAAEPLQQKAFRRSFVAGVHRAIAMRPRG